MNTLNALQSLVSDLKDGKAVISFCSCSPMDWNNNWIDYMIADKSTGEVTGKINDTNIEKQLSGSYKGVRFEHNEENVLTYDFIDTMLKRDDPDFVTHWRYDAVHTDFAKTAHRLAKAKHINADNANANHFNRYDFLKVVCEIEKERAGIEYTTYRFPMDSAEVFIGISNIPREDGRYLFINYQPAFISETPVVEAQYISSDLRDKFIALCEQYKGGEDYPAPVKFSESKEWNEDSEKELGIWCETFQDVYLTVLSRYEFLVFIKDYVCKEYDFESEIKEDILDSVKRSYNVDNALYAAELLEMNDLVTTTKQMLNKKDKTIIEKD